MQRYLKRCLATRVDYVYDLVSGNVNQVKYQDGQADAFYHKYEYDADNRITNVYTSSNPGVTLSGVEGWNQDAKYFYYKHGPLARTEIGDQKVQAMDYAYTIQGWIKAVNSNNLAEQNDIGKDGDITTSNTLNGKITRDAMAYSLGYFRDDATTTDDDYSSIGGDNSFIASVTQAAYLTTDAPNLYNGNISHMVSSIRDIDPGNGVTDGTALPQLTAYKYDQLNRISQMKAYRGLSSNDWQNATTDNSYQENFSYDPNGNILTLTRNGVTGNLNMDNLTYLYKTHADGRKSNQLKQVQDAIASTYSVDIDNQSADNYTYDEIGNLKSDAQEEILNIEWTVYGKIKKVVRTSASTKSDLEFKYDASGNRVAKIVKPDGSSVENGGSDNPTLWTTTYYVRDAQGNTMATYEDKPSDSDFYLQEQNIFGSSRLGVVNRNLNLTTPPAATPNIFTQTLGKRNYELSNHLGNVLTVVSDRKLGVDNNSDNIVDYYLADVVSATDMYSGGMPMPGRQFNSNAYRYGHNSQEKVDEISGNGNHYTAQFWEYDARTIRRWERDPVVKHHESPYACFANNPIWFKDPNGKDSVIFFDQAANPDNKRVYTAQIYVVKSGQILGPYTGSTYPNYPDSKEDQNTVGEGWHHYNNASGHHSGRPTEQKGLNIVDENGSRYNTPGTDPQGNNVTMELVNVHSGQTQSNGLANRGSAGCPTIEPSNAVPFFNNFTWTNALQTTGTSTGEVGIFRGQSGDALKKVIEVRQILQNAITDGQSTTIETNANSNAAWGL